MNGHDDLPILRDYLTDYLDIDITLEELRATVLHIDRQYGRTSPKRNALDFVLSNIIPLWRRENKSKSLKSLRRKYKAMAPEGDTNNPKTPPEPKIPPPPSMSKPEPVHVVETPRQMPRPPQL